MKFVLAFTGSRGDVQPAVAVGVQLRARGHEVRLAVPPNLVEFVRRAGLPVDTYGLDTKALLDSDLVAGRLKSANPVTRLGAVSELTLRGGRQMQAELMASATDADLIISGSVGQERALNVAQARGIPYLPLHYCPMRRNSAVSLLPVGWVPRSIHRLSWVALEHILWRATRAAERTLAADLGLPTPTGPVAGRISRRGTPEIQAYDPLFFPGLAHEWGANRPLIGFLDLASQTRSLVRDTDDSDVAGWLAAGPAPIYVGFGSMTVANPDRLARTISEVTDELGYRVLVAAGWGEFMSGRESERIKVVRTVDHATVLPRCAAAVHHGGAGSTAASVRAGIPTLVCSLGADQPMWGRRIRELGVGAALPLARIDHVSLRSALRVILQPDCVARARRTGPMMISPDLAVETAVRIAEQTVGAGRTGILPPSRGVR